METSRILKDVQAKAKKIEFANEIGEREFSTQETMRQIIGMNLNNYMCWGVSKKVNYYNKALMLQVNGLTHKGKVWIVLGWDDTYTVYFTTNQLTVLKKSEMIYFDMLNNLIDGFVEKGRK